MAEQPNSPSGAAEAAIPSAVESTDVISPSVSAKEKQDLFRSLQGEISFEQYEAWNKQNAQTGSFVLDLPQSQTGEHSASENLLVSEVLSRFAAPNTQQESGSAANTLSVSQVWSILEPDDQLGKEEDDPEETVDSVLDHADTSSCMSAISKLQAQARSTLDDEGFSKFAQDTPEVLAKYLTGKMTFEEFSKVLDESKKSKGRSERNRKRKADGDFVYEEEEDYEAEDDKLSDENVEDESWVPDAPKTTDTKKKARKPRRRQWQLPKSLYGLMGETNTQLAMGNHEEAVSMCLELIRRAPAASEPYDTLAMIYDEKGETTKATEFLLMSAYLKRTDTDLWVSVANRLLKHNETRKALQCLTQAIRFATTSKIDLMQDRCDLYEQMGEASKALMGYSQMLNYIEPGPENDDQYLKLAHKICEAYHGMKRTNDAARVLTTMFKTRPSLISSDDMNKLLELRMTMKQYQACLEGLVDYCGVEAMLSDGREWNQNSPLPADLDLKATPGAITSVKVPDNLPQGFPLDLLTKLCTCLIYLGFSQQAKHLVEMLLKENVEDDGNGERFLDVADAYMESDQSDTALPILHRCVNSKNYGQAAVWLRYGECLSSKGQLPEAVEAFSKVVELAPNHLGARFSLSALQQQIGRHEEALQVLSKGGDGEDGEGILEDQSLLLHKCQLLFSQKRSSEFLASSRRLLFSYFHEIYKPGYLKIVFGYRSLKHRNDALRNYMRSHPVQSEMFREIEKEADSKKDKTAESKTDEHKVTTDELWDLYLKMCDVLLEEEKWDELSEVTLLGLTCPAFSHDPAKVKDAEFLCLTVCLMTKNGQFAYSFIKDICIKDPENPMAWNLFTQSLIYSDEIRHHKFCLRRLLQWPENIALGILNGHNSLQNGSYRYALSEYVAVFRRVPTDPLINLCIGLCYIHICCQKLTSRKDWLIIQGVAFLNSYLSLRGHCQETYYNIGRALHQLDLGYAAVYYYKKALSMPPVIKDKDGTFDLKRETAFNLSLIYKKSGNMDLARLCLQTYIVV